MCSRELNVSANLQAALDKWAVEAQCSCIDIDNDSQFIRIWMFCMAIGVMFCMLVTLPMCWGEKKRDTEAMVNLEDAEAPPATPQGSKKMKSDRTFLKEEEDAGPEPNFELAAEHLRRTSATLDGKWRPIWGTSITDMAEVGGTGMELYFRLLRNLGIIFIYMAALTCASTAFSMVSNFAPDNGQILAKTTIGNVGAALKSDVLSPDQRYIVLKHAGGCQGTPVTKLTAIMGWLDLLAIALFFACLAFFRFHLVPKIAKQSDDEQITPRDFAVEIDKLPRRFDGMEELGADGKTKYQHELEELLCQRVKMMRQKEKKRRPDDGEDNRDSKLATADVKVEELVLVRDYNGKLGNVKAQAQRIKDLEIAKYCGEEKQVEKLQKQVDQYQEKLDKKLAPEDELDVVRAYAILSTSLDAQRLLTDYRFSTYGLARAMSQCLANIGVCECCCPVRNKMFRDRPIRVRKAPEPSNIIWENQDVPWLSRFLRRSLIGLIFFIIVVLSFVLVYSANYGAKMNMSSNNQLLGNPQCDPDTSRLTATEAGSEDPYKCLVWNATEWTMDFVENSTQAEKACYCGAVGYGAIIQDSKLINGVCKDWLISTGTGVAIGVGATAIVVVINISCKFILLALAEMEKPLSYSGLNSAKMVKIFALQTLNTGFVIFCVNFSPPDWFPLGKLIFVGEYGDSVRGWYAVVGAAILSNMLANAVTPAVTNVVVMWTGRIMRCLCQRRQKHQALLLQLYTNPEFDMAARFAQLLTTIFVTMAYSAGMPMLYFFAAGYMAFTYWADKIVLLRGSYRPPAYDTQIPKEAAQIMLYAVPIHCIFALWMFGQPCTFPSNPLGGTLASLADQGASYGTAGSAEAMQAAGSFQDRITKESTWMIFLMLLFLIILWVLWTVTWILGGTLGEFGKACVLLCCPKGNKVNPEGVADMLTWEQASTHIEKVCPPASYEMERHPAFASLKDFMGATRTRSPSPEPGNDGGEDAPEPAGGNAKSNAPVDEGIAKGFLNALKQEYLDDKAEAVGKYFEDQTVLPEDQDALAPFEKSVREGAGKGDQEKAIRDIAQKWSIPSPV